MPSEIQLKAYAISVDARLDQLLPGGQTIPAELHEAMRYSCLAPGKRLRPALCLACAEAVTLNPPSLTLNPSILDAACSLEMVHCFSLIHDDLPAIDDDDLRRGRPSCHIRFGEAIAILAGDALFSLAFEILSHVDNPSPDRVLRAVRILTKATGSDGLVGGEVADVLSEGKQIDPERLQYIHSRKTGSLIAASCEIGAILAGGSQDEVRALRIYGEKLGLAFQITDDILNETSDAANLGKSAGSDRERGKSTFPAFYGLEGSRTLAIEASTMALSQLEGMHCTTFLVELAQFAIDRTH